MFHQYFKYCFFVALKIHVSETFKGIIEKFGSFVLETRGQISVKVNIPNFHSITALDYRKVFLIVNAWNLLMYVNTCRF